MMIADSDVLIDFLRDRPPWAGRIELEIKTGHLATTAINSFELLSGAKSDAEQEKVSRLLAALTVLGLTSAASERAAEVRRLLESQGQGIGMADYLIAGVCLANGGVLLTRNQDHFSRVSDLKLGGRHL
ncbi:MAG TPA: type II toxin-antitoxin system VapC family toxin [Polyangia bacterium]